MTEAATETAGPTIGPFAGRFAIGSAALGVLLALIGIVGFVDGWQELDLFLPANEPLLEGLVLLTFALGFAVVALFIGAYMESGFGDDDH